MRKINAIRLKEKLSEMMNADIAKGNIAGAAARVLQGGACLCEVRKGYKNIETKEPLMPHAMFRLASLTKPVTAVAALIGVQNGWFSLDDPIAKYYPEFSELYIGEIRDGKPIPVQKAKNEIRVYHLLSHSSGILCGETGNVQMGLLPSDSFRDIHAAKEACTRTLLSFEAGEGAAYSAYHAFDILLCLLEEKSGMPYADFLAENILNPLGISDITYTPTDDQWERMVSMHDRAEGNRMLTVDMGKHTYERFPLSYTCGGAGLAGSIEAYGVFAEMLRCEGTYNGIKILDKALIREMRTPHVAMGTPGLSTADSWGLGVRVCVNNALLPKGTYGWSGAYGAHFWIDPENAITAIYMKNNRWHESGGCGRTGREFEKIVMDALDE